jgi:hypothetical protein
MDFGPEVFDHLLKHGVNSVNVQRGLHAENGYQSEQGVHCVNE